jgi:hypothetical protein
VQGRESGVAVHGNRIIAALVLESAPIRKFQNPQEDFDVVVVKQAQISAEHRRLNGAS